MTTFFEVKGNVKFNGVEYKKDSIASGEISEFQLLVNGGLFSVIEDAETLEQAQELVKLSKETIEDDEVEEEKEPENTWGPKPDKEEEEITPSTDEDDEVEESEEGDEVDTSKEDEEDESLSDDDEELS